MVNRNPQAVKLNAELKEKARQIYSMLSRDGKDAFFPHQGILGQGAQAKGKKYNATVGQAFRDDGDPMVLNAFTKNLTFSSRDTLLYSPSFGQPELRKIWQHEIRNKNPSVDCFITLPVAVSGLTHGIYVASDMFIHEGEKLIIPDKFWGNYNLCFKQAEFDSYPLFNENQTGFNIEGFREKLKGEDEKKIVLLNFPNNPSGYSPTVGEAEQIKSAILESAEKGNKMVVICDDAYFGLAYEDEVYKESIFAKLCGLHENVLAVKVDGLTKESYVWGLRVAFITFGFKGITESVAKVLEDKAAGTVRKTISSCCTMSQRYAITALSDEMYKTESNENHKILLERFSEVKKVIKNNPQYTEFFEPLPFNSGYFMCIELKKRDPEKIRKILLEEYDTGLIAIDNMLRFAFSSVSADQVKSIFDNVYEACKKE